MPTTPDRYLIAIGQRIEPRIYRTQDEAESAAQSLAYRAGKDVGVYRLSDTSLVTVFARATTRFFGVDVYEKRGIAPFRPDGSSWLDKPAEGK